MKKFRLPIALCCLIEMLAFQPKGNADEFDALTASLRESAETLGSKLDDQHNNIRRLVADLEGAAVQGDSGRVRTLAQQLALLPATPPELKTTAERLSRELPRFIEARTDAFVSATEDLVERTRRECLSAEKESDLMNLLRDLGALQLRQPPRAQTPIVARALRKLEAALKSTEAWMDFLLAREGEGALRAVETLRQATMRLDGEYPIFFRKDLDQRLAQLAPGTVLPSGEVDIFYLLARIKTLQDVETVSHEIDRALMPAVSRSYYGAGSVPHWFHEFRTTVAIYLSGDLGEAWRRASYTTLSNQAPFPTLGEMLRLQTMLLDELVPRALKLPPGAARRPDENHTDHLRRLVQDAVREGRWEEVQRLATKPAISSFSPRSASANDDLATAVGGFLEGQRLEAAADYPGAMLAYERVLRSTAELAPVREASDRLKALRESQPKAFAEAHPRLEADRFMQLFGELDRAVQTYGARLAALERERSAARPPGLPTTLPSPSPAAPSPDVRQLETRLQTLEARIAGKIPDEVRFERLELLLGPGAEALARRAPERDKFRIWLGPDFTVYRSALPKNLEAGLTWQVSFNGHVVLRRNAGREFFFRYPDLQPGNYAITLRTADRDTPESNVLEFTITAEAAAKLPKIRDNDLDRDGIPNRDEGGDK